jgi:hypothetical protein
LETINDWAESQYAGIGIGIGTCTVSEGEADANIDLTSTNHLPTSKIFLFIYLPHITPSYLK